MVKYAIWLVVDTAALTLFSLQPMFIYESLIQVIIQQIIPFLAAFLAISSIVMLKLSSILNRDSIV